MPCMKKVHRGQKKGVGPLFSSQGRRALAVPLIDRGLTASLPLILFPHSIYIGFRLFVLLERRSGDVFSMPWRVRGTFFFLAINSVGTQSYPTPPCCLLGAPTGTARDMSGFGIRQVFSHKSKEFLCKACIANNSTQFDCEVKSSG